MSCEHNRTRAGWFKSIHVYEAPHYLRCVDCEAWLSLGVANDVGCFVEIEAARICASVVAPDSDGYVTIDWESAVGGAAYDADGEPPSGPTALLWHIGWLTRCALDGSHDEQRPLTLNEVKDALAVGAKERAAAERYRRVRR